MAKASIPSIRPKARTSAAVIAAMGAAGLGHTLRDARQLDVDRRRHIPSGVFRIDQASMGGIPTNAISQVVGERSAGKTTVTDMWTASAQRIWPDGKVARIDAEGTMDFSWSQTHGVDLDRILPFRPETGEDALNIADELLKAEDVSLVVLDSVAALVPGQMLDKSIGETLPGVRARLVNDFLNRASATLSAARNEGRTTSLLLVNQLRHRFVPNGKGDSRVVPGGEGLNFYPSLTLALTGHKFFSKNEHGEEVADRSEIVIRTLKTKLGRESAPSKFLLNLNPDHPRGVGFVDQAKPILDFTDKRGLTGRTASGPCDLGGYDGTRFKRLGDREEFLLDRPELFGRLYDDCITAWRRECGKGDGPWKAGAIS